MVLCRLSSTQALQSRNKNRKWPSVNRPGKELLHPITKPYYNGKLRIEESDIIATFGSCFAMSILRAFPGFMNIIKLFEHELFQTTENSRVRYNVFSMLNQLRWAYGLIDDDLAYSGIFQVRTDNIYGDYHGLYIIKDKNRPLSKNNQPEINALPKQKEYSNYDLDTDSKYAEPELREWLYSDKKSVSKSCQLYNERLKKIRNANFFIFTLGMAEVWYDLETNLYLNRMPPPLTLKRFPNRFEFRQLDYFDVLGALEEIYDVLMQMNGSNFKILLTVSPVPYETTFTPVDGAISANSYSKSVQRTAVESFVASHENAAYFPAYEMAVNSDHFLVWEADRHHVRQEFVDYIMSYFLESLGTDAVLKKVLKEGGTNVDVAMERLIDLGNFVEREKTQQEQNEYLNLKNLLEHVSPDPGGVQESERLKEEIDLLTMKYRICHKIVKD